MRAIVSLLRLWGISICDIHPMMLSGSGCVVSALQCCRCRLCRSCICDQIYQQDLNHIMSCFESSHVFLNACIMEFARDTRRATLRSALANICVAACWIYRWKNNFRKYC